MNRRPVIGPLSPPPLAEPPSAVVPHPVSTSPAATAPRVSFRREAVRIVSSCVSGGFPPIDSKVASAVARVTLACAKSFVVVVVTVTGRGGRAALGSSAPSTSGDARVPAALAGRPAAGAAGGHHPRRPGGRDGGDGRPVDPAGARDREPAGAGGRGGTRQLGSAARRGRPEHALLHTGGGGDDPDQLGIGLGGGRAAGSHSARQRRAGRTEPALRRRRQHRPRRP